METLYVLLLTLPTTDYATPMATNLTQDDCLTAFSQTAYKPELYQLMCFPITDEQ